MSDTEALFAKGLSFVENSQNVKLSTDTKLRFYGLYKVATAGPAGPAPSRLQIIAFKKWQAWKKASQEGATQENAKDKYIQELSKAVPGWDKQQAKL